MTLRFVIKQKLYFNDIVNTLSYEPEDGFAFPTPERIAELLVEEWTTFIVSQLSSSWSMVGIDYYDSDDLPGTPAKDVSPASLPLFGNGPADAMANQVAFLVNWRCNDGPPWRGRTNIGGMSRGTIDDAGTFDATSEAAVAGWAYAVQVLTDVLGPRARLVICSTGSQVVPAGTTAKVDTGTPNNIPATQRRRRIGSGS